LAGAHIRILRVSDNEQRIMAICGIWYKKYWFNGRMCWL